MHWTLFQIAGAIRELRTALSWCCGSQSWSVEELASLPTPRVMC